MSRSREKKKLRYLAQLAQSMEVSPERLADCILEAWKTGESRCSDLTVKLREVTDGSAIFLFFRGKGQAQIPLAIKILESGYFKERLSSVSEGFLAGYRGRPKSIKKSISDKLESAILARYYLSNRT